MLKPTHKFRKSTRRITRVGKAVDSNFGSRLKAPGRGYSRSRIDGGSPRSDTSMTRGAWHPDFPDVPSDIEALRSVMV